jgi:hypothetical protein
MFQSHASYRPIYFNGATMHRLNRYVLTKCRLFTPLVISDPKSGYCILMSDYSLHFRNQHFDGWHFGSHILTGAFWKSIITPFTYLRPSINSKEWQRLPEREWRRGPATCWCPWTCWWSRWSLKERWSGCSRSLWFLKIKNEMHRKVWRENLNLKPKKAFIKFTNAVWSLYLPRE